MNIIYNSGSDFIKDNYQIISSHQLETIFFVENAKKTGGKRSCFL